MTSVLSCGGAAQKQIPLLPQRSLSMVCVCAGETSAWQTDGKYEAVERMAPSCSEVMLETPMALVLPLFRSRSMTFHVSNREAARGSRLDL